MLRSPNGVRRQDKCRRAPRCCPGRSTSWFSRPSRSDTSTGYGVLLRIEQITRGCARRRAGRALSGALPASSKQGLLATAWGVSDNNRRAKFYRLTPAGRRRLEAQRESWQRLSDAMSAALDTRPGEV